MKRVLILGSGGREHALAWKMAQSEQVEKVFVSPGNGGVFGGKLEQVTNIGILEIEKIIVFVKENKIDFVVVAPDDALAGGVVDALEKEGIVAFGASQKGAQIESSKAFAKMIMEKYNIPTAKFKIFNVYEEALDYVETQALPIVVKASGLALGKGVYICNTKEEAQTALEEIMLDKKFGSSGSEVVIEEFMQGTELSIHAFCDGKTSILFPASQDHKRIFDNDKGPNTGGMGTIAPLTWINEKDLEKINNEIVKPLLAGLKKEGSPFKGLLYPGLMEKNGEFKVVEFNARFGDPETQVYMQLLESDLYDILHSCATGTLDQANISWSKKSAACISVASCGYPGSYEKGFEVSGIDKAEQDPDIVIFHASTKREGGRVLTNGGRVLSVNAVADSLEKALEKAYNAVDKIHFEGMHFRKDIGQTTLNYKK